MWIHDGNCGCGYDDDFDDFPRYHEPTCRYVSCDEDCRALQDPKTLEEALKAVEHWRAHSLGWGCSHCR